MSVKSDKDNSKKLSSENERLKSTLDNIGDFLHEISEESKFSAEMITQNISTDFANKVDYAQKNPIEHAHGLFQYIGNDVQSMLDKNVENFLLDNKSLIKKAVKAYGNKLIYTIVLKDDNLKNRSVFLNFLNDYNESKVASNFRIIFNFLPTQFESFVKEQNVLVS